LAEDCARNTEDLGGSLANLATKRHGATTVVRSMKNDPD